MLERAGIGNVLVPVNLKAANTYKCISILCLNASMNNAASVANSLTDLYVYVTK